MQLVNHHDSLVYPPTGFEFVFAEPSGPFIKMVWDKHIPEKKFCCVRTQLYDAKFDLLYETEEVVYY